MVGHAQRGLAAALDVASRGALLVAGLALLAMTVVVGWGVFGRFVLNDTPAWVESSALLLMGWVIMGAAAVGVREGFHMGFETLRDALPEPLARTCKVLSDLCITGFGAGMAWFGGELALEVMDATLATIGLPGSVEYLPLVLGGVLITLFGLERLVAHAAGMRAPAEGMTRPILTDA